MLPKLFSNACQFFCMKKFHFILLATSTFFSCHVISEKRVEGDGISATEERRPGTFSNINLEGPIDVVVRQGSPSVVKLKADKNLLSYIETKVEGNTLHIRQKQGFNLESERHMRVVVTAPVFHNISLEGSGDITSEDVLINPDKMSLELNGSGDIEVKVNTPELESRTKGSGDITLDGAADKLAISVYGSGDIDGFNLNSQHASISINGSGNARVYATRQLTLNVNGSGDVEYKGGASVNSRINGSGSVSKAD